MIAFSAERRRLLLAALGLAPAAALASAGCAGEPPHAPAVELRLPLAQLPEGRRLRVSLGDRPVELLRRAGEVRARSLWCTHMGCEVAWSEERGRYLCPCHDGEFDADGQPVGGPPKRALRALEARIEGDAVVIRPPVAAS